MAFSTLKCKVLFYSIILKFKIEFYYFGHLWRSVRPYQQLTFIALQFAIIWSDQLVCQQKESETEAARTFDWRAAGSGSCAVPFSSAAWWPAFGVACYVTSKHTIWCRFLLILQMAGTHCYKSPRWDFGLLIIRFLIKLTKKIYRVSS